MAKVTGVGGVFFKSSGDAAALRAWYREHLGMQLEDFGGDLDCGDVVHTVVVLRFLYAASADHESHDF